MEHDDVEVLRRTSAAWRLLRADTAPLVLSFLGTVFVEENVRSIGETELVARLDDHLYLLARGHGVEARYPRTPQAYVDHWANPEQGWLRAWYPPGSDEPHYDATPAVEQAVRWVTALRSRTFVGTESRLNTVFELLRQLVVGTQTDPAERLRDLEERRRRIDDEIAEVRAGRLSLLDAAAQRDRYQQLSQTAADLLSDFREVEANFRALDRRLRERITGWDGAKGELLDEVVRARGAIADSDQGRSFHAFYDFLLDRRRQEEFADLVGRVQGLDALSDAETAETARLRRVHYDWLDAGERTQATVRTLSEQLRRFLDDQVWRENRRVIDILRSVEARALALRDLDAPGMALDMVAPEVVLPTERPLFTPRVVPRIDSEHVESGDDDFDADILFDQVHVDPGRLARTVHDALGRRRQVSLAELVDHAPLDHGLAELMTYLALDDPRFTVVHDDDAVDEVAWAAEDDRRSVPDDAGGLEDDAGPGPGGATVGEDGGASASGAVSAPGRVVRVARMSRVTYARRGPMSVEGRTTEHETRGDDA